MKWSLSESIKLELSSICQLIQSKNGRMVLAAFVLILQIHNVNITFENQIKSLMKGKFVILFPEQHVNAKSGRTHERMIRINLIQTLISIRNQFAIIIKDSVIVYCPNACAQLYMCSIRCMPLSLYIQSVLYFVWLLFTFYSSHAR